MKKRVHFGKCCICGKEDELTFEHIPPRKALNDMPAKSFHGDSFKLLLTSKDQKPWDTDGLKYENQQRGVGKYSLCKRCNNYTGTMYGNEYSRIARSIAFSLLSERKISEVTFLKGKIKVVYPLRFIKQVLSMFCSTTEGLSECFPEIRKALLDKEYRIEGPDFNIYMFVMKTTRIEWTGINAMMIANVSEPLLISELDVFPLGFVFDYDPVPKKYRVG